jgi:tetratricopeptide (TPR) repeat protein
MRKNIPFMTVMISAVFCLTVSVSAEERSFSTSYTYQAASWENKASARIVAQARAKKVVVGDIAKILLQTIKVKDPNEKYGQIAALAAAVVHPRITGESWKGRSYHLQVKATGDLKDMESVVSGILSDEKRKQEFIGVEGRMNALLKEIDRVRNNKNAGKGQQAVYEAKVTELKAIDSFYRGYALFSVGQYSKAIDAFNRAIDLNPGFAEAYLHRGNSLKVSGDSKAAVADFKAAIRLNKKLSATSIDRGGADYKQFGKYRDTMSSLDKEAHDNPQSGQAYLRRASAHARVGNYLQAVDDCTKAIAIDSKLVAAYNDRALAYGHLNEDKNAIADLSKAISLSPDKVDLYYNRMLAYSKTGDHGNALQDCRKAMEMKDSLSLFYRSQLFCMCAQIYEKMGNVVEALNTVNEALRLNPEDEAAYVSRGDIHIKGGNYDQAVPDFSRVIQLNPENSYAYFRRGTAYRFLGDREKALSDYSKCAELNSSDVESAYAAAAVYAVKKDEENACKWLEKAGKRGFRDFKRLAADRDFDGIRQASCLGVITAR